MKTLNILIIKRNKLVLIYISHCKYNDIIKETFNDVI